MTFSIWSPPLPKNPNNGLSRNALYPRPQVRGFTAFIDKVKLFFIVPFIMPFLLVYCANFTIEFSRSDRNAEESNVTINSLEESILSLLMENPRFTSSDLTVETNKSLRTINRILASLKAKKIIKRIGSNKSGHWEIKR